MATDLLESYRRSTDWTAGKIAGLGDLEAESNCPGWSLRDLVNHVLETQRYFASAARGQDASPPGPNPPPLVTDDPRADFELTRTDVLDAFEGADEKTATLLGIAFADSLLHGWDLARSTGQDTTMPEGLPEAAYEAIHGRFTDEQRKGVFGPELEVGPDASPQDRLLAYTGRTPG